ncbi:globin domain-containing protein [Methylophaga pinxianii]|uniref:globin domain-containing protein n=1 Tax=Methylophaga pinxianii TaxID=2881052 RepID=UPI001CF5B8D5|nr:globin domain-containing protein [Methylophaga pinxianii]MCB2427812.1 globin domain-containing protein [Methylophaga pinxianii]UPH45584.1 globin domain-containing protein [Methylophaga pinxianii]
MAENALRNNALNTGLDEHDITLVEHNFAALIQFSEALAERFYQRLFAEYPELSPLFKSVTIEGQHKKLLASMVLLIQHLHDSEMITDYLQGLGVRHQQYGVEAAHYEMFIENWLAVLGEFADQTWDNQLQQAWRNVLEYVAELMQTPVNTVNESKPVYQSNHTNHSSAPEYALTELAVAQTATPMLILDLNLVVCYLNAAAESLLNQHQNNLQQLSSKLSIDRLIGTSLHDFAEKVPFPISWFEDFDQLPRSMDLHNAVIDLRLTISVLYKNDVAQGFLLECYPQLPVQDDHAGLLTASQFTDSSQLPRSLLSGLEKALHEIQMQNSHLSAMLQEIDEAVFETSLLALNCTVEAAKLGDEARQMRDFAMEIRVLNRQLSQLLQPLKVQSGQQQQQLNKTIALTHQLETELGQQAIAKENQNRQAIQHISDQLSVQTQALTQLIGTLNKNSLT